MVRQRQQSTPNVRFLVCSTRSRVTEYVTVLQKRNIWGGCRGCFFLRVFVRIANSYRIENWAYIG